ncbi:MAG: signal recognition particle-docking protein FtsY [bacterium]|nr:signal recognition particle-docking protein FtsY [bacterium]
MESKSTGWFQRLCQGLSKTHTTFMGGIERLLRGRAGVDEELFEELEEVLILADLGYQTAHEVVERLREAARRQKINEPGPLRSLLRSELLEIVKPFQSPLEISAHSPFIMMVLGVNGVGKTTTIGKLAARYSRQGKKVLLAAGDTFRAAAIEQLEIWGQRAGCSGVIKHRSGSDPSAVVYDSIQAARSRHMDLVIIDTAGRLHTKDHLVAELQKMKRVISKELPEAPHEILLVLDATTGQNALQQAKQFNEALEGITGLALTKLDGTAKGGIIFSIVRELAIPIRLIGVGEGIEDLRDFEAEEFIAALFETA